MKQINLLCLVEITEGNILRLFLSFDEENAIQRKNFLIFI